MPAAQAAGPDHFWCSSTKRQNPPIQQNRCNFSTSNAIWMKAAFPTHCLIIKCGGIHEQQSLSSSWTRKVWPESFIRFYKIYKICTISVFSMSLTPIELGSFPNIQSLTYIWRDSLGDILSGYLINQINNVWMNGNQVFITKKNIFFCGTFYLFFLDGFFCPFLITISLPVGVPIDFFQNLDRTYRSRLSGKQFGEHGWAKKSDGKA